MVLVLRIARYAALVVVCAIVAAELVLQFHARFIASRYESYAQDYNASVLSKLHTLWVKKEGQTNPLLPPLPVFTNSKYKDENHLRSLAQKARLPANGHWEGYDFIQTSEESKNRTAYTANTNSLGFRGIAERNKDKPSRTFRIVVLGSYQAFGLGVEDAETYPAKLEAMLNDADLGYTFEVWNGARPAGTAIIGLAQMENDIFGFEPDLLILDYGFIDHQVTGDNLFPTVLLFPDSPFSSVFGALAGPILGVLDRSMLWRKFVISHSARNDAARREFMDIMQTMVARAETEDVPVLLVRQLVSLLLTPEQFSTFARDNNAYYFDVFQEFREHPPAYPPPSEWTSGSWASTWLNELDPEHILNTFQGPTTFWFYPYRLDIYQLNLLGMEVVARGLAELIETQILAETHQ